MRVAIQDFQGSFHQAAAHRHFGAAAALYFCATLGKVVAQVTDGRADAALVATENSLAGSVLPTYLLLERADLAISGEVRLAVQQHLLALAGVVAVHSRPVALRQCDDFLARHPHWQLIENEGVGLSAWLPAERRTPGVAVVAGARAAAAFGLQLLAPPSTTRPTTTPVSWCWGGPRKPSPWFAPAPGLAVFLHVARAGLPGPCAHAGSRPRPQPEQVAVVPAPRPAVALRLPHRRRIQQPHLAGHAAARTAPRDGGTAGAGIVSVAAWNSRS